MNIRRATLNDVPQLVLLNQPVQEQHAASYPKIFRSSVPDDVVAEAFKASIASPSSFWLVADDAGLSGFLSAEFRTRQETWYSLSHQVCYLSSLVVAEKARRRGVGRALVYALQHECRVREIRQIDVEVWSFNDGAKAAYDQYGFAPLSQKLTLWVKPA